MMKRIFCGIALILSLFLNAKTWIREYTYQASEADSKITSRSIALEQVKRLLLQEIGVYVHSTVLSGEFEASGEVKDLSAKQIEIISAGITETKILEENWNGVTYYIKAEITADENDVISRLDKVISDKEETRQLEDSRQKTEEALAEIERLKQELTQSNDEKEKLKMQNEYNQSSNKLSAEDWFQKGKNADEIGEKDNAILYYQKTLELNPTSYKALINLGIVYQKKDSSEKAYDIFIKAISVDPDRINAYGCLGLYYESHNEDDMAVKYFEKVIDLDSLNIFAYEKLIKIYTDSKNYNTAVKYIKKLAAISSNRIDSIYYLAMFYYRIGLSYKYEDDYAKAKEYYRKVIAVDPEYINYYIQ